MFIFCDVLHETKQKRKHNHESAQYRLEIIFKSIIIVTYQIDHRSVAFLMCGLITWIILGKALLISMIFVC